jgi:hypothetical protein
MIVAALGGVLMSDPKQQSNPKTQAETGKQEAPKRDVRKDDHSPGELIEGEASPGLTITGGGGHA